MSAIEKFNGLGGTVATRASLIRLRNNAKKEGSPEVVDRIETILQNFPQADEFELELERLIKLPSGLGASRHSGLAKEALDECGRLRAGYVYKKGGIIEKVEKLEKSKPATKDKKSEEVKEIQKELQKMDSPSDKKTTADKKHDSKAKKIETQTYEKKSFAPEEWLEADTKKTTYLIKKYLKQKYGINVRVKSEYYSGGSSLNIYYDFGPASSVIEAEMKRLQYGRFDGMIDMYEYSDKSFNGIILDGFKLNEYKFVFVRRDLSKTFKVKLAQLLSDFNKFSDIPEFDGTYEGLSTYFGNNFGQARTWSDMVYQKIEHKLNLATQEESEIKNISIGGNYNSGYYLDYEFKGKKYNSQKPVIFETSMVKEKRIVKNQIKLIDYGKNQIAVIGYTGEIEDTFEDYKYIKSDSIVFEGKEHSGFIFSKKDTDSISNILIDYASEKPQGLGKNVSRKNPRSLKRLVKKPKTNIRKKKISRLGFVLPNEAPVSEVIHSISFPAEGLVQRQIANTAKLIAREQNTAIAIQPKTNTAVVPARSKNPLIKSMAECSGSGEFYGLDGGLGEFLGRIEKKPKESVVITLDAPQGAGKTRLLFQIMNLVMRHGYPVLFFSFEEHRDSDLFTSKRDEYIDPEFHEKIDTVCELPRGYQDFKELVDGYEWIFTDSFGKKELLCGGKFDLDNDQRKAFDGKVFFDIYQRTQDGRMRGGSTAQFDADAVMKIEKDSRGDYKNNVAFFDKHRYHTQSLDELRYNIFHQELEGTYAEVINSEVAGNAHIAEII